MSVSGPTICGTGADGGGAAPWSNPGNITLNDGSFASVVLTGIGTTSNELVATNFGFAIPNGAVVSSVQVDVFRLKV